LQNNGGKMEFEELNRIPYSLEAERALIGGIFFDVNSLDEIKKIVVFCFKGYAIGSPFFSLSLIISHKLRE